MKPCDGCNKDKPVRSFCFTITGMMLCLGCYRKLQAAGVAPKSFNWDGTRTEGRVSYC
jgi:hypothetical protein